MFCNRLAYILFFIHVRTRRIVIAGATLRPNAEWAAQQARNVTGFDGALRDATHLVHDRDSKYPREFDAVLQSAGVRPVRLPPHSPNLNAFAERLIEANFYVLLLFCGCNHNKSNYIKTL